MVSTRGGARTSGGTTANMLAKKPLRRTAAKDPPTQTTATKAKSKKTRANKPEGESEAPDEDIDELQDDSDLQTVRTVPRRTQSSVMQDDVTKPVKKSTTRVKRDEEPAKDAPATKSTAKVGRPKGSKNKPKAKSTEEEKEKPDLPPPAASNATRATRATASTAAKGRAPPLSPKKVTQVAKVAPKTTRSVKAKSAAATARVSKPAPRGRPAIRRRNVSNENVEPETLASEEQQHEQESEVSAEQPAKTIRPPIARKPAHAAKELADQSPATKRESAKAVQQDLDDSEEDEGEDEEDELSLETSEHGEDSDAGAPSGDELLGPKTPLKRCNPPDAARFASIKMSPTRVEFPIKTPVRRFHVLGTQQGTPQTQKPYCKPSIPMSEIRPMTVARAHDRAMVFPRLQPLPRPKENEDIEDWEQSDTPEDLQDEEAMAEEEMEQVAERQHPSMDEDYISDTPVGDVRENSSVMRKSMSLLTEDENELHDGIDDDAELHEESRADGEFPHFEDTTDVDDRIEAVVEARCPENIMPWGMDDSMTMNYHVNQSDEESLADNDIPDDVEMADATPRAETLQWENIREDITIPFNFDANLAASRGLPQIEPTERLEVTTGLPVTEVQPEPSVRSEQDVVLTETSDKAVAVETDTEETAGEVATTSGEYMAIRNSCLRLSELIDVNSLAQSTGSREEQATAGAETSAEGMPISRMDCSPSIVRATTTPAKDASELDIAIDDTQDEMLIEVPSYARATISSRRKSLPAIFQRTPSHNAERPPTSHGLTLPRVEVPYGNYLFAHSKTPSKATLARPRTSVPHGLASEKKLRKASQTPVTGSPVAKTPATSVPDRFLARRVERASPSPKTPTSRMLFARTPGTSVPDSVDATAAERFPGMPHNSHDSNDTADLRTTVSSKSAERFPGLPASNSYEELVSIPKTTTPGPISSITAESPQKESAVEERFPGLPARDTYSIEAAVVQENFASQPPATPAGERYPGLPAKRSYEEHAKTVVPPSRFRTPTQSPAKQHKRPATSQKPASLRRAALKASATPIKTPLKAPAMTTGMEPMTPHPAAPLRGVVALVEVYTTDGGCATPAFTVLLQRLGAKTTKTFSERITHLVFKEGSPTTLQRLRVHNKQVTETGVGHEIHCVNSRWVSDCDTQGSRMDETDEAYAVDVEDVPRAGKRRRKSMEPTSLLNIDGNVVRDRKSSLGRSSLSRISKKFDTPSEAEMTPQVPAADEEDKENNGGDASPATPAYLAAPSSLVQQTAPMNRMRKLDFKDGKEPKSRRLTFFGGGEF